MMLKEAENKLDKIKDALTVLTQVHNPNTECRKTAAGYRDLAHSNVEKPKLPSHTALILKPHPMHNANPPAVAANQSFLPQAPIKAAESVSFKVPVPVHEYAVKPKPEDNPLQAEPKKQTQPQTQLSGDTQEPANLTRQPQVQRGEKQGASPERRPMRKEMILAKVIPGEPVERRPKFRVDTSATTGVNAV